jgi:hypothetical protein
MTGLGKHCTNTRTDSIPSQDALIRAALEVAAIEAEKYTDCCQSCAGVGRRIRALADDPQALAAIKAKAIENRT